MNSTKHADSTRHHQLAKIVTELSSPAVCVVAGLAIVAWHSASQGADAAWAGLAILLCAGIPMAYVIKGVRAGKWSDHHIQRREQRLIPLLVGLGSVAAASVLLILVGAPRPLIALVLSQLAGLVAVLIITRFWKVSIHCATAGGLLGVLLVLYGPWVLLGLIPMAAIAWSRVVLDAHTWAQVLVGTLVGFLIGCTLFPLLA